MRTKFPVRMEVRVARKIDRLGARSATTLGAGLHADGGGLYLRVEPTGARRWVFIYRRGAKRHEMGFGALADIPLSEARNLAQDARRLVKAGRNPIEERRRQRAAVAAPTFGHAADQLIADISPQWRNPAHRRQWKTTLTVDAAELRPKRVDAVTTEDVLAVLKPIWHVKPETAARLRGRIERVLDAAKANGHRQGENPARWKGHLSVLLPRRQKRGRGHHAALPYAGMSEFFAALRASESISALALEFTILTAARTGEAIGAKGLEFDLANAIWTVPAERMKMDRPHRVPLSSAALAIVRTRIVAVGAGYLFPGLPPRRWRGNEPIERPISNMAMSKMLKLLGYGGFTVHGFRSSFRDWTGDRTSFPREIAEAALAHLVGDEAEQAYRRGDALDRRRKLMEAWAAFCEPGAGKVVRIA